MQLNVSPHTSCRVCQKALPQPFLNLGLQPLANNLLDGPDQSPDLYPLALTSCPACSLIQLTHTVDPHVLFDHYYYLSGVGKQFKQHLEGLADSCIKRLHLPPGAAVLDIGGNDGTLLHAFQQYGCRVLNVEPAKEPAVAAAVQGVPTINRYFDDESAVVSQSVMGPIDLITATNVFAHVDDVRGLVERVKGLLKPDGSFVVEVPDARLMLEEGTYDLCYHEHLSYWTPASLEAVAVDNGLFVNSIVPVESHGGSLRVTFEQGWASNLWQGERGVDVSSFSDTVTQRRQQLRDLLNQVSGDTLAAYTAPAKATVIANYCGLQDYPIQYVADDAPTKQGKYLPLSQGKPIPILPFSHLKTHPVDTLILFSWNLSESLLPVIAPYCKQVLIPMPVPRLVKT